MFRVCVCDKFAEASAVTVNDGHWMKIFDDYIRYNTRDSFRTVSDNVFFRKDAIGVTAVIVMLHRR